MIYSYSMAKRVNLRAARVPRQVLPPKKKEEMKDDANWCEKRNAQSEQEPAGGGGGGLHLEMIATSH